VYVNETELTVTEWVPEKWKKFENICPDGGYYGQFSIFDPQGQQVGIMDTGIQSFQPFSEENNLLVECLGRSEQHILSMESEGDHHFDEELMTTFLESQLGPTFFSSVDNPIPIGEDDFLVPFEHGQQRLGLLRYSFTEGEPLLDLFWSFNPLEDHPYGDPEASSWDNRDHPFYISFYYTNLFSKR